MQHLSMKQENFQYKGWVHVTIYASRTASNFDFFKKLGKIRPKISYVVLSYFIYFIDDNDFSYFYLECYGEKRDCQSELSFGSILTVNLHIIVGRCDFYNLLFISSRLTLFHKSTPYRNASSSF